MAVGCDGYDVPDGAQAGGALIQAHTQVGCRPACTKLMSAQVPKVHMIKLTDG